MIGAVEHLGGDPNRLVAVWAMLPFIFAGVVGALMAAVQRLHARELRNHRREQEEQMSYLERRARVLEQEAKEMRIRGR